MEEIERQAIPGFPRYEVTSEGHVYRVQAALRGRGVGRMPGTPDKDGYLRIHMWDASGKKKLVGIHQIVCLAFHGAPPTPRHEAAHNDGIRDNNRPSNLRWATRRENALDATEHGTQPRGALHGRAKLDADKVREIRHAASLGFTTVSDIARRFDVSRRNVRSVIQRLTWAHIE